MAFVNDKLAESEIREYVVSPYQIVKDGACTIDREKNLRLYYTGHPHEDNDRHYFLFVWNETMINVSLRRNIIGNTIYWKLTGIDIPSSLDKYMVLEELENALKEYRYVGASAIKIMNNGVDVEVDFSTYLH
ncbi:MAG: hypothetical protein E7270_09280 [Lachnospiraceae bacterium]|nr:hypothetical protein [Lachnospiraceae bacterium]